MSYVFVIVGILRFRRNFLAAREYGGAMGWMTCSLGETGWEKQSF